MMPFSRPPSIESLLGSAAGRRLIERHGRLRSREALRAAADLVRHGRLEPDPDVVVAAAAASLDRRPPPGPRPVLNATGVLLHTNLGRAPLPDAAREAILRASGYSTLEYDAGEGTRGRRGEHVRPLLLSLFAPSRNDLDALAVTNNAAALLLALDTLACGRPVVVSRGELVAIGGDFRVPSILARSGASLREVGTTNKTTPADYEEALREGAALVLKVRPSNYRIVGYTEEVEVSELSGLAHRYGAALLLDAGSAVPARLPPPAGGAATPRGPREPLARGLADEPIPIEEVEAGADLVTFSADKTLGGPQAGVLLGLAPLVARAAGNPLARALRLDKLALAALAATLDLYLSGREEEVPFVRMARASLPALEARARRLAVAIAALGASAEVRPSVAVAGGGAGAESTLASFSVEVRHASVPAGELHERLRRRELPLVCRVGDGALHLDLRTLAEDEDEEALRALAEALAIRDPAP